jgi:tRNA-dihydrouridine synthase
MQEPRLARAVVAAVRRATDLPLSAKIRLGERLDEAALAEFCRLLEGEGVDLVAVHARLRGEPYGRTPRWGWIGAVKQAVAVPVVGNGGIFSAEDARRCLEASGCDGLMVGRGAVVRPWLCAELEACLAGQLAPPRPSRPALFFRFLSHLEQGLAPERRLGRLKEFTSYFSQTYPFGHTLASSVQASATVAQARDRARAFFLTSDPSGLEACG